MLGHTAGLQILRKTCKLLQVGGTRRWVEHTTPTGPSSINYRAGILAAALQLHILSSAHAPARTLVNLLDAGQLSSLGWCWRWMSGVAAWVATAQGESQASRSGDAVQKKLKSLRVNAAVRRAVQEASGVDTAGALLCTLQIITAATRADAIAGNDCVLPARGLLGTAFIPLRCPYARFPSPPWRRRLLSATTSTAQGRFRFDTLPT